MLQNSIFLAKDQFINNCIKIYTIENIKISKWVKHKEMILKNKFI